jgi:phosphate transport system permease protein
MALADGTLRVPATMGEGEERAEDLFYDSSAHTRFRLGFDRALGWLLPLLFLVAIIPILDLAGYIASQALPTINLAVLTSTNPYNPDALGVPILSTIEVMAFATALAAVLGLFGGIATAEFLPERAAGWVRMSANMLVGTPSVVLGYFGYFLFCVRLGWGFSYIAGTVTLAFFMTPYIFRTADLAFSSVPRPIREAALGCGAKPSQYIRRVGTPIAFPQILNGIFLALAIGVGETAPIVLTTTFSNILPQSLTSPVTFLTATIWANFSQPANTPGLALAFQAALLLLLAVVGINIVVRLIAARYQRRLEGLYQ